jgi:hypothetical protein
MAFALAATAFVDMERIAATIAPGGAANPWVGFVEFTHEVYMREIIAHIARANPFSAVPSHSTVGQPFPLTYEVDLRYEEPE